MTFKPNLDRVKANQHAKYLGKTSLCTKVIVQTHTADRLIYLLVTG